MHFVIQEPELTGASNASTPTRVNQIAFRGSTTHCGGCGSDSCPIAEDSGMKPCITAAQQSIQGFRGLLYNPMQIVCSAIKHDHEAAHVAHDSVVKFYSMLIQCNNMVGESAQIQAEEAKAIRLSSANSRH